MKYFIVYLVVLGIFLVFTKSIGEISEREERQRDEYFRKNKENNRQS